MTGNKKIKQWTDATAMIIDSYVPRDKITLPSKVIFKSLLSIIIQIAYNVKAIFILDFLSYNLGCFEKFCEKFHINSIYHYLFSVEKSILVVHLKNLWTPFTRRCEAILYTTHLTFIALHLSLCIDDVYLTRNFFCRWQNSLISPRVQTRSYYV